MLITTEASLDDKKKLTCEKNNCPIHTMSLDIICLLVLLVITIIQEIAWKKNTHYHINIKLRFKRNKYKEISHNNFSMTWSI